MGFGACTGRLALGGLNCASGERLQVGESGALSGVISATVGVIFSASSSPGSS